MRNRFLDWAFPLLVIALFTFTVVVRFLAPADLRIQIMDCLLISVGVAVLISYVPALFDIERGKIWSRANMLSIGILATWSATTFMRTWWFVYNLNDDPAWMRAQHDFALMVNVIGGLFHLAAPSVIDGRVPMKTWLIIGSAIGGGILPLLLCLTFGVPATIYLPLGLVFFGAVVVGYRYWRFRNPALAEEIEAEFHS